LGIAALVIGVFSFFICWVPFLGIVVSGLGLLLGLGGLVLAIVRRGSGIGFSVAGSGLSAVSLLICLVWTLALSSAFKATDDAVASQSRTNRPHEGMEGRAGPVPEKPDPDAQKRGDDPKPPPEEAARKAGAEAEAKAEQMMDRNGLSQGDKRYVRLFIGEFSYADSMRVRIPSRDERRPPMDVSKPLRNGDFGTPYYRGSSGQTSKMVVDQIIGPDEMVVWGARLYIKGVSAAGLDVGSTVELKGTFLVDGTGTYTSKSGNKVELPCLVAIDMKKVSAALACEEVKAWIIAKVNHENAQSEAARKASEKPIPYEVLRNVRRTLDGKHVIDVLVAESAKKQEVLKLAESLRREYAGSYAMIVIYDSRAAWRAVEYWDGSYPTKELDRHQIAYIGSLDPEDNDKEVRWVAEGRDH
jgi:hypothetical protein